jgi:hypothetical protein
LGLLYESSDHAEEAFRHLTLKKSKDESFAMPKMGVNPRHSKKLPSMLKN